MCSDNKEYIEAIISLDLPKLKKIIKKLKIKRPKSNKAFLVSIHTERIKMDIPNEMKCISYDWLQKNDIYLHEMKELRYIRTISESKIRFIKKGYQVDIYHYKNLIINVSSQSEGMVADIRADKNEEIITITVMTNNIISEDDLQFLYRRFGFNKNNVIYVNEFKATLENQRNMIFYEQARLKIKGVMNEYKKFCLFYRTPFRT